MSRTRPTVSPTTVNMKSSSLLAVLSLTFAAVGGLSLEESQSFENFLSGLKGLEEELSDADQVNDIASALELDLDEFEGPSHLSRFTRNAGNKGGKGKKVCCKISKPTCMGAMMKHMKDCGQLMKNGGNGGDKESNFECVAECICKKMGLCDEKGNTIEEKYKDFKKTCWDDTTVLAMVESAVPPSVKSANADAKAKMDAGAKCNPAAKLSMEYVIAEMEVCCPEDKKDTSAECDTVREDKKKTTKGYCNK